MRHILDQYDQPENRLTHALMSCLVEDKRLLLRFLKWTLGDCPEGPFSLSEQALPGEEEVPEGVADKRGIPDGWIHSDELGWALLIESKVSSPWSLDQIRRHFRMAEKRGYKKVLLLAIGTELPRFVDGQRIFYKAWRDIYCWLCGQAQDSQWADKLREYFEIWEVKMAENYLKKETITRFAGIPFSIDNPYRYGEAKRVMGLLIDEVKKDRGFVKKMGIDVGLPGRPAKTGKDALYIWDFLRVKESRGESDFTAYPHLTFSIQNDKTRIQVTVPHRAKKMIWDRISSLDNSQMEKVIGAVLVGARPLMQMERGAKPYIHLTQRHYLSQKSLPVQDADLWFDLRTVVKGDNKEKYQPEWLAACCSAMRSRRSNIQLGIGFDFPIRSCASLRSEKAVEVVKRSFYAMAPFLNVLLDRKS